MTTLITNIKQLVNVRERSNVLRGKELAVLPCIKDAYLLIEGDTIIEYGEMSSLKPQISNLKSGFDAKGGFVLPAWCDSHTHLVFPASREEEFVDKLRGASYAEIAARGGAFSTRHE